MRNLASGNKTRFTIFIFIILIILVLLTSSVVIVLKNEKEEYIISSSEILYDSEYNYINLENTAKITKKWTGSYYLNEDVTKKEYKLGNFVVGYDKNRAILDLYGKFYEVVQGGNINKISGYNNFNTLENKFYKMDDRKYLIIGKNIANDTGSLSTSNYLIIVIDKLGNALLLNDQIEVKTINKMVISTDKFDFDVANEILKYKEDNDIDLKKIIGSTNEYVERTNNIEENITVADKNNGNGSTNVSNTTNNNNNSSTIIQNGSNTSESSKSTKWVDSLNGWIGNVANAFVSIYNKDQNAAEEKSKEKNNNKSIALNSIDPGTAYLDINYTVNDPENIYNVVYVNIESDSLNEKGKTVSLDKRANSYRFTNLKPDTSYSVTIGYKLINSDGSTNQNEVESFTVKTSKPIESLEIAKLSKDKVEFTLNLDGLYQYNSGAKIKMYCVTDEGINSSKEKTLTDSDMENATTTGYNGWFDFYETINNKKYYILPDNYQQIIIKLEDTYYGDKKIDTGLQAVIQNY